MGRAILQHFGKTCSDGTDDTHSENWIFKLLASEKLETNAIFPARPCGRTAEIQSLIHRHSGIEANDNLGDPILALVEGVYAVGEVLQVQYPGFGAVITNQNIAVMKSYRVGEAIRLAGRVSSFEPNARGAVFTAAFTLTNASNDPLAEMASTMLLFDPAKPAHTTGERAPRSVAATEPTATAIIGHFTFTPDATRCFEQGYPPSPHSDPQLARAAGFPKPIVSGNQVFSMIWKRFVEPNYGLPVSLNFALKRPIFWDEQVSFEKRLADPGDTETLEVRKADGKTAIVGEISGRAITR